jgi:hypothetical protein
VYRSLIIVLAFTDEDMNGSFICCWFYVADLLWQVPCLGCYK